MRQQTTTPALATTTTAQALLETVPSGAYQIRQSGGTLVRFSVQFSKMSQATNDGDTTIWALIAATGATASTLPDPTGSTDEDVGTKYLFVIQNFMSSGTVLRGDQVAELNIVTKAMRKLQTDQSLFILAKTSASTGEVDAVVRTWWKLPQA